MKITDGILKRLQRRLLKVVKEEYSKIDGNLYCEIDDVSISNIDGFIITYSIRFGRQESQHDFQKELQIYVGDGKHSLDFIAGQFYQKLLDEADGN